jgi:lipoate-protein ligase A
MSETWRMIDTGIRPAAENMAMNRAILEAHQEGKAPHTLRFLQFTPCALLGFHQSAEQELRTDYCKENGIDIQRRMTGGGAIYFDETQIGWELYLDKKALGTADMAKIAERICTAAAKGMSALGVEAKFRPRNDIEVDGRKISGTGGAFDGDSILYQGTLLVDFNVGNMMRTLRIPAEKLSDKAISSAQERIVNLKELLGEAPSMETVKAAISKAFAEEFDVAFEEYAGINDDEQALFEEALKEIDSDEWVYQHNKPLDEEAMVEAINKSDGGLMRVAISLDKATDRIKQLWLTGDFFVKPRRLVVDFEAAMKDTRIEDLRDNVHAFFTNYPAEMLRLGPEDFITVIEMALASAKKESETA